MFSNHSGSSSTSNDAREITNPIQTTTEGPYNDTSNWTQPQMTSDIPSCSSYSTLQSSLSIEKMSNYNEFATLINHALDLHPQWFSDYINEKYPLSPIILIMALCHEKQWDDQQTNR